MKSLPPLEIETLRNILESHEYGLVQPNGPREADKFYQYWNSQEKSLLTIPKSEIISEVILDQILLQANIPKLEFIENIKKIATLYVKDSYIVYIDILGYKNIIRQAKNDERKLNVILNQLNSILKTNLIQFEDWSKFEKKLDFSKMCHVKFFSDNLLYVSEIEKRYELGDFLSLLNSIADFQLNLAVNGLFVRGIILADKIYCDDTFVFGPAILTAEELEKSRVQYPRIIIEQSYVDIIKTEIKKESTVIPFDLYNEFIEDDRGYWFVNYLFPVDSRNKWIQSDPIKMNEKLNRNGNSISMVQYLRLHKKVIETQLKKIGSGKQSIIEKYQWVGEYHNYFCKTYFAQERNLIIKNLNSDYEFYNPIEKIYFR